MDVSLVLLIAAMSTSSAASRLNPTAVARGAGPRFFGGRGRFGHDRPVVNMADQEGEPRTPQEGASERMKESLERRKEREAWFDKESLSAKRERMKSNEGVEDEDGPKRLKSKKSPSVASRPTPPPEDILKVIESLEKESQSGAQAKEPVVPKGYTTVFGAKLDDDVAGKRSGAGGKSQEEHERLFEEGVVLMRRGAYREAKTAFTRATAQAPGGLAGRTGGQYAMYLAEALQATGQTMDAVELLKRCEAHPDKDVRKAGSQLLYIVQAPELKLSRNNFVSIPDLQDIANKKTFVQGTQEPPPAKYSLEWYVQEAERKGKRVTAKDAEQDDSRAGQGVVVAAILAAAVAGVLFTSGGLQI